MGGGILAARLAERGRGREKAENRFSLRLVSEQRFFEEILNHRYRTLTSAEWLP